MFIWCALRWRDILICALLEASFQVLQEVRNTYEYSYIFFKWDHRTLLRQKLVLIKLHFHGKL